MKTLQNLNEKTKKIVTPLIEYLDKYYAYNEEISNEEKVICYGSKTDYVKLVVSNDSVTIYYSNHMSIVFVKNNYPLAKVEPNCVTFNFEHSLPYILIYVTFDKSLDI